MSRCARPSDAAASALRQWRYERPAQAPIQFYVKVTFRPGAEAVIAQSSESYLREPRDSRSALAETDRDNANIQNAVASLQAELDNLKQRMYRELERAQNLVERGLLARDPAVLQAAAARANAQLRLLEAQLERARAEIDDRSARDRSYRAMAEQLRLAEAQARRWNSALPRPSAGAHARGRARTFGG
jgi:chromosome segregation ATPase